MFYMNYITVSESVHAKKKDLAEQVFKLLGRFFRG
jgi:hypothetical protein